MNAKELVADGLELVTLPDVYLHVKKVLENSRSGAAELAAAIETDPALCARLLRMANSPFFGFAAEIGSVARAVSMLGTVQVHDMVLATSLSQSFSGVPSDVLDVTHFWQDSVRRGIAAKTLAGHCNLLDGERVFLAGLLCHVGEMVIALRAPEVLATSAAAAIDRGLAISRVQHDMFGFDYAEVGGELLRAWCLPQALEAVVRLHTAPQRARDFALETAIVHVAAALAENDLSHLNDTALNVIDLDPAAFETLPNEIERQAGAVFGLLYPSLANVA